MKTADSPFGIPVLLLYNVNPSWPARDVRIAEQSAALLKTGLEEAHHPVAAVPITGTDLFSAVSKYPPQQYVVLNWCEELPGIPRSDAWVAGFLESMQYAFTGSTAETLALSWDKSKVKNLLSHGGVPTPSWKICKTDSPVLWDRFPAIVKPALEHCSIGVSAEAVVLNSGELKKRVRFVHREFRQPALVEDFIDGREFHVTLWGNGEVVMLPPAEMDFSAFENVKDRLCTFDSKFSPGSRHYEKIRLRLPATLTPQEYKTLESAALGAYRLMNCRDYARIDLRLKDGIFYVLDVNPNADLSPDTSLACAAQEAGYTYGALGSRLVWFAAQRHPDFGRRTF